MSKTKEADELLEAIKFFLLTRKNIMEDGKVDFRDFPVLIDALANFDVVIEGVEGAEKIPDEMRELSALEAMELGRKFWDVIVSVKMLT